MLPNCGEGAWQRTRFPQGHVASITPSFSCHENLVFASGTTRFISAPANSRRFFSSARLGTEAHGAAQHFGARRHGAARQVDLGAAVVHPHVLEAHEEIGIARAAEGDDIEKRRQALVGNAHIEVLEVDDVAHRARFAIVLLEPRARS